MAHSEQREVGLAADTSGSLASLPIAGRITITFWDVEGHVIPEVSFAPLGRINPNTIERYLPHIYQEIQKQQVKERHNVG